MSLMRRVVPREAVYSRDSTHIKQAFFQPIALGAEYTCHNRPHFYPHRSIRNRRYRYMLNLLPDRDNPLTSMEIYPYNESRKLAIESPAITMDTLRRLPAEELTVDPIEFKNLAKNLEYQNVQNFLHGQLQWRQQTIDPLLDAAVLVKLTQEHYGA